MLRAGQQPEASSIAARHKRQAVLLDLVQPLVAPGRAWGIGGQAGLDEAG
jgi:hypothetical protein